MHVHVHVRVRKRSDSARACQGDVLIAAVGKAELVRKDWVKPGAVVLDVGINFVRDASRKSGALSCLLRAQPCC